MPRPANRRGPLSASARFGPPPRLEIAISGGVHVVGRPHQAVALPPHPQALAPMRRRRLKLKSRGTRRLAGPSPQATDGQALFFRSQLVRLRRCVCSGSRRAGSRVRGRGTSRRTLPLERSSSAWPKIPGLRPLSTLAPGSADFDWRIGQLGLNRACNPGGPQARCRQPPLVGRSRLEASCEWVVPCYRPVRDWDLPASGHAELLPQDVRVSLRRSRGDAEALAHFVVRAPGGDELDDLPLPLGDRRERLSECVVHGVRS